MQEMRGHPEESPSLTLGLCAALLMPVYLSAAAPPSLMLWAWERPGDLRGISKTAGVAFLASSVYLRDGGARVVPRFQPLQLTPGTYRLAVVRIEAQGPIHPLTANQRKAAVDAIVDTVRIIQPDGLQIDFDARASERPFYASLLRELRARVGARLFLSMTALVSWCGGKSWLDELPVDEVVPMSFEMGPAGAATETLLRSGGQFDDPACRGSIGISVRDLPLKLRNYHRIYVFAYEDWTGSLARSVLAQLQ
jgi:hypothetical protein